jgi:hypothetical protein
MKTKFFLILSITILALSCKNTEKEKDISSTIEGIYVHKKGPNKFNDGYTNTLTVSHVEENKYGIEFKDIKADEPDNPVIEYHEYEYRPEKKILYLETIVGTSTYQFSEDFKTLTHLDGVQNIEHVKQ